MNNLENPKIFNAMESPAGAQITIDLSQNMSPKTSIPGLLVRYSHDMVPTTVNDPTHTDLTTSRSSTMLQ